jgi:hypothetical protein
MDFGTIKNTFTNLIIESQMKNDDNGKKLYKEFLNTLKENENLKTTFKQIQVCK